MTTAVELDDSLVQRTVKVMGASSEKEAIEEALQLFLRLRAQSEILELRGNVKWEGNLEESRLNRFPDDHA